MTDYYNQSTGRWESPEEMGERPATAETVLASDNPWKSPEPPSGYILALRAYAKAAGIRDFDQYLPASARNVDDQGEAVVVEDGPLALPPPGAPTP